MTARRRSLGLALAAVAPLACATHTGVTHQVLSGPYRGQTAEGQPVVVTFAETEQAFRGTGSIADQPIVLAGAVGWRGVATLARSDGSRTSVRLELSADGE